MKILCLYPSLISGWQSYKPHGSNESSFSDHSLMMLSAVLKRAGHDCFCMDLRSFQGWDHFEQILKQQSFDLTLTTFYSANEIYARQAVEIVKRNFPNKYIIGGGVHLSVTRTREYPNIDTIVWGEGEPHILNIVETIQSGKAPEKLYELKMIDDLDSLPYADRGLFNREMEETSPLLAGLPEPFITIVAGRGCPHQCSFCLDGETLVMMADLSHKKIKDIKQGEKVIGLQKRTYEYGAKKVIGYDPIETEVLITMSREAEVFEITTDKGTIITTGEHPFMTPSGRWRYAKFFRIDDLIRTFCYPNECNEETDDYKKGYISGSLYGDGHIKHRPRKRNPNTFENAVQLVGDDEMIDTFYRFSMDLGFTKTHYAKFNGGKIYYNINRCVRNNTISEIEEYKKIKYTQNPNKEFQRGFLSGFFDADRSNAISGQTTNVRLHNLNKELLLILEKYLNNFGFKVAWEKTGLRIVGGCTENNTFVSLIKPYRQMLRRIRFGKSYARVDSIKRLPRKRMVYNLHTGTENFIANGLISHNCSPTRELINGKKCRIRSVNHFLGEIIQINNEKPIGSLMIHDDLLGTKKWMDEFIEKWHFNNLPRIPFWCQLRADTILRIKDYIPALSEIGLQYVSIGLESGNQRMLDFLKKGTTVEQNIEACQLLHANDINVFGNFISGLPTETEEDILGTEKMLSAIRPAFLAHSIFTSYPGSYLYDWVKENNYWVGDDINDPQNHYSMHRFPFERKIKGIDYERIFRLQAEYNAKYKGELRTYTPKPKTYINKEQSENKQSQTENIQSDRPKASVILVTYNRPEFLYKAIDSIFKQTMQSWELIILDYTEDWNINEKVYQWAIKDKRVRYIRHRKNINNIAYCWNEGLDLIRGDFWCTLDDDNTKYPEYLNKMVAYLEQHPENDAVVCPMEHTGETSGVHYQKPVDFAQLKTGNRIDSGQVVYRRAILEKIGCFDENLVSYDDWDYMCRVYSLNNFSGSAFGWLDGVPLCSYHWHKSKRMYDQGIKSTYNYTETRVKEKQIKNKFRVLFYEPGGNGRTESQKQLSGNILEALKSLTEVVEIVDSNPDLIILSGTLYNMSVQDLQNLKNSNPQAQIVALLCEDPQALHVNINYAPYIDWLVTNDLNAFAYYIEKENDPNKKARILHWNNLSISNKLLEFIKSYNPEKEYDVCLVGYPYDSRVNFIRELRPLIKDRSLVLIGDTWQMKMQNSDSSILPVLTYDTKDEIETAKLAMKSKIILVKHRDHTDIGGFPVVAPLSVNRGYIEAVYRSVLMVDNRPEHSFNGSVITYTNAVDCANWINRILDEYDSFKDRANSLYNIAIERFTMRERLLKILNCVRSPRYNKRIE